MSLGQRLDSLSLRKKLLVLSATLIWFTVATGLGWLFTVNLVHERADLMVTSSVAPMEELARAHAAFMTDRAAVDACLVSIGASERSSLMATVGVTDRDIDTRLASVATVLEEPADLALMTNLQTALDGYRAGRTQLLAKLADGDVEAARAVMAASMDAFEASVDSTFDDLFDSRVQSARTADESITSVFQTAIFWAIVAVVAAIINGSIFSWVIGWWALRGVKAVQQTLGSIADKCATWLAEGMERLRDNDLTYAITPVTPRIEHYASDEIGKTAEYTNKLLERVVAAIDAYNEARNSLTGTINDVQEAAIAVTQTSEQLNAAATQSGTATQQVATTINQVASGASEQARAASDTDGAVRELASVIASVEHGAAETSASVGRSLDAVNRMQTALTASDRASADLKPANERAAAALVKVTSAIEDNAAGMARIKTAVDESAVKVAELGAKGEQIGAIVETIDDIAEQTNLLALNAAIEAARAGEMGKGFAVVADEVRKLAERSGRATKEIASLIAEVQKGTSDAVNAMSAGSAEVETGLQIGKRGAESVVEIGQASRARDEALERVFSALTAIAGAATQVTSSSDDIARVVAQTSANAATMAQASDSVTRSISSIAAVSEENSAAAEEVSAATEEMSAQAEEVVASAATLAEMAQQLDALVARFKLETASARAAAAAPRRDGGGKGRLSRVA